MPNSRDNDPYRNFRFKVECAGITVASFSDVSGFDMSIDVIEYRNGEETITPRKLPGLRKHGNITLKRGVVDATDMFDWIQKVTTGKEFRKENLTITLLNEAGEDGPKWQVKNCWPVKYSVSDFKGTGNEVLMETLEIAHEEMERVKG